MPSVLSLSIDQVNDGDMKIFSVPLVDIAANGFAVSCPNLIHPDTCSKFLTLAPWEIVGIDIECRDSNITYSIFPVLVGVRIFAIFSTS